MELGNLRNLQSLRLNENQLTGWIPVEVAALRHLRDLQVHENQPPGEGRAPPPIVRPLEQPAIPAPAP